jgi:hypothetical protein
MTSTGVRLRPGAHLIRPDDAQQQRLRQKGAQTAGGNPTRHLKMIYDPTEFTDPVAPTTNWIHLMLQGAASLRRGRHTSVSRLPPRLLEDIGLAHHRTDGVPRRR